MPNPRLTLALASLTAGEWRLFEKFAAEFNAAEFPSLRTTASASGDKGRDGEIHIPREDLKTALQYSVTQDWSAKIRGTVKTLKENFPKVNQLIYCTNIVIGPQADDLVKEFRKLGTDIDIRDQSWFVDRELTYAQRQIASEEIIDQIVTPLLSKRGVASRIARPLESDEARVAVLHLALEGYDQKTDRNLTRSCFESLVRSVLQDTSAESTLSTDGIYDRVRTIAPAGDDTQVRAQVQGALNRLSVRGGPVKQVGMTPYYHLSFEESAKTRQREAEVLLELNRIDAEIRDNVLKTNSKLSMTEASESASDIRDILARALLSKGESFASSIVASAEPDQNGSGAIVAPHQLGTQEIVELVRQAPHRHLTVDQTTLLVEEVLDAPSGATRDYLRRLADGYTLFAFLRQTPDVQKVVLKVFQEGDIWLDTSILLPVLAETLLTTPEDRHFTTLLSAARDAGLQLYVTGGVIEEVERHLNRGLVFCRTEASAWESEVPFIFSAYALSGRGRADFPGWLTEFRGDVVPEQDIAEYLAEEHGITLRSLEVEADSAEPEFRGAVQEIWHEAHERRRGSRNDLTPATALRLVAHDVENYVGVVQLRKGSNMGPLGYKAWWLTLDRVALVLARRLTGRIDPPIPPSPVLSPDFLVELLRLGPMRSAVERDLHVALPVFADISRYEQVPKELIEISDQVRRANSTLNERVIQRKVRDALNEAKWRLGSSASEGLSGTQRRIQHQLKIQAGDV
jgi:hypothetical protein